MVPFVFRIVRQGCTTSRNSLDVSMAQTPTGVLVLVVVGGQPSLVHVDGVCIGEDDGGYVGLTRVDIGEKIDCGDDSTPKAGACCRCGTMDDNSLACPQSCKGEVHCAHWFLSPESEP